MRKTNSKNKDKSSSQSKDIKLPIIDQNKKQTLNRNNKTISANNLRNTSTSKLSKNSLESKKSIKNSNSNNDIKSDKLKIKRNTTKINDIITNVNKSHNINSKINNNNINKNESESPTTIKNKENENKNTKINNIKSNYRIIFNKKNNIKINEDSSNDTKINKINNVPRITKEKLKEIQERRRIRLIKEKKEFELQTKLLNEKKDNISNVGGNYITKKGKEKDKIEFSSKINSPIEISHKKAQSILEEGGMIDAYKYLISHLCKNGLPPGNLYEYCSELIKNYEKEWKKKKYKIINEKIQKYFDDKKKLLIGLNNKNDKKNNNNNNINLNLNLNLQYKVLEKREDNQFIKKLDKSRSTLRIIKRNPIIKNILKSKDNDNNKISKSNSYERKSRNRNELNKINADNINFNSYKNENDDKRVYFNIKLKKNESAKPNNNTINDNKNNKIENYKIIKTNKNNNLIVKKEAIKSDSVEAINKSNKNIQKIKKEENKNEIKNITKNNSKSSFKNIKNIKSKV